MNQLVRCRSALALGDAGDIASVPIIWEMANPQNYGKTRLAECIAASEALVMLSETDAAAVSNSLGSDTGKTVLDFVKNHDVDPYLRKNFIFLIALVYPELLDECRDFVSRWGIQDILVDAFYYCRNNSSKKPLLPELEPDEVIPYFDSKAPIWLENDPDNSPNRYYS